MTDYVIPVLLSERETAPHMYYGTVDPAGAEDCVPCSVVMACNALHPGLIPNTHAKMEELRHDAGYPAVGATAIGPIIRAAQKRYGLGPVAGVDNWRDLWDALTPGHGAVIIGRPANLPTGSEFRQYLPNFTSLHCVYVQRRSNLTKVFVLDPMAPSGPGFQNGYWAPQADLAKYVDNGAGIYGASIFAIAKA